MCLKITITPTVQSWTHKKIKSVKIRGVRLYLPYEQKSRKTKMLFTCTRTVGNGRCPERATVPLLYGMKWRSVVLRRLLMDVLVAPSAPTQSQYMHTHKKRRHAGQSSKTSRNRGGNSSLGHSTFMCRKRLAWQAPIMRRSVTFISSLGQKCASLCLR